ncbi:MAG: molecular chaperone HtpG [Pseudomonadota bacterium]
MSKAEQTNSEPEEHQYEAEVSRLLGIVTNALYSEREIFLRELISNAADSCDRLRYQAIAKPALLAGDSDFKLSIQADKKSKTLTIEDNGIGMNRSELVRNLGTIARSGTSAFVDRLSGDAKKDMNLIGQFGVGFYASFMVSDQVQVFSRKAGEQKGWCWISKGKGTYSIQPSDDAPARGVRIVLKLKGDAHEFLEAGRLQHIVRSWSDHIQIPVLVGDGKTEPKQANNAGALWTKPKSELTDEQYQEFYRSICFATDTPWKVIHSKTEGMLEYTALLFVPTSRPFDLFDQARKAKLRLYVNRIFITDDLEGLIPGWLRFLRGIVDSSDLPLNISREMLQKSPTLDKIRKSLVGRILSELTKAAEDDATSYEGFWAQFGMVLKEGLYESHGDQEKLLKLCRFKSTNGEGWRSLADYVADMREGQKHIYYLSADTVEAARQSPQLEIFRKKKIEVLFFTDPIDEFWSKMVDGYEGKSFTSLTRGELDLEGIAAGDDADSDTAEERLDNNQSEALTAKMKAILGDKVSEVRVSTRLADSAVCIVAGEQAQDLRMQRLMRGQREFAGLPSSAPVLEINPAHALIRNLASQEQPDPDICELLFEQATIQEGDVPANPGDFARKLSAVMARALALD